MVVVTNSLAVGLWKPRKPASGGKFSITTSVSVRDLLALSRFGAEALVDISGTFAPVDFMKTRTF